MTQREAAEFVTRIRRTFSELQVRPVRLQGSALRIGRQPAVGWGPS